MSLAAVLAAGLAAGCQMQPLTPTSQQARVQIPRPINLLLPREIKLHPFTGTRTFDAAGGIRGIDVRVQALDAYGDATKAFGEFRFELFEFVPNRPDPKGNRVNLWNNDLLDPKVNLVHWDPITRTYAFKLQWFNGIPVGERFVLTVTFASPYTDRLFDERVFVSGE